MEHIIGGTDAAGKYFASIVRRVLELAAVEGHPEPDLCGVPSLSVSTSMTGIDATTGKRTTYAVIAEAPMPVEDFAENLQHRVAGFVFRSEADADSGVRGGTSSNDVHIPYVESSLNVLRTLDDDEKDSFLEDRALIVNRLVTNSVRWDPNNTSKYVQNVRTRPVDVLIHQWGYHQLERWKLCIRYKEPIRGGR
jgi:hypothetical protein